MKLTVLVLKIMFVGCGTRMACSVRFMYNHLITRNDNGNAFKDMEN
jgi:hypothetical protein